MAVEWRKRGREGGRGRDKKEADWGGGWGDDLRGRGEREEEKRDSCVAVAGSRRNKKVEVKEEGG